MIILNHIEPLEVKRTRISLNTKTKTSGSIPRFVLKDDTVKPLRSGHHQDLSSSVIRQRANLKTSVSRK